MAEYKDVAMVEITEKHIGEKYIDPFVYHDNLGEIEYRVREVINGLAKIQGIPEIDYIREDLESLAKDLY